MNPKAAPLLGYDWVKEHQEFFFEIEEIQNKFKSNNVSSSNKGSCATCYEVGVKKRFSDFLINYLIDNKRLDVFQKLPSNMVVPYGRQIYRVREIIEKSGRITG